MGVMAGFYEHLVTHARQFPQRAGLDDGTARISFGDLPGLIERYQACLLAAGLTPGSTVGLTIRNEIAHLLVTLALFRLPAHQVTLAGFETVSYHDNLIERLNVSHLVTIDEAMDARAPRPDHFHIRKLERPRPTALDTARIYFTTSGTTKGPRIIVTTQELLQTRGVRHKNIRLQRVLMTPSIQHGVAMRRRLLSLFVGSTSLFWHAGSSWQRLASFAADKEATFLQLSSLDAGTFARESMPVPIPIFITGARIPWALRKAIRANLSRDFYLIYGASECGVITMAEPDGHDERETVGKPRPGVTVEISDGDGSLLPAGEVGEIRVKAPGTVDGYYDDAGETAARFRGGWFYPGDMGSMTKDGELIIHGRKDDMMIMNGINIYPLEIERVLETHPAVSAAAAFAIRSRLHGDIPAVAVELLPGASASETALMQYSRDKLGLRYPRRIVILDKMPRGAGGKILKNDISASVTDEIARP